MLITERNSVSWYMQKRLSPSGLQRDVVHLGWPIAPSYMSPKAGGGGSCGVSANEYSCTVYTGAPLNFGDLTPYLTYDFSWLHEISHQKTLFLTIGTFGRLKVSSLWNTGQAEERLYRIGELFTQWEILLTTSNQPGSDLNLKNTSNKKYM